MRRLLMLEDKLLDKEACGACAIVGRGCGWALFVQSEIAFRTRCSSCRSSNPSASPRDRIGRSLIP